MMSPNANQLAVAYNWAFDHSLPFRHVRALAELLADREQAAYDSGRIIETQMKDYRIEPADPPPIRMISTEDLPIKIEVSDRKVMGYIDTRIDMDLVEQLMTLSNNLKLPNGYHRDLITLVNNTWGRAHSHGENYARRIQEDRTADAVRELASSLGVNLCDCDEDE